MKFIEYENEKDTNTNIIFKVFIYIMYTHTKYISLSHTRTQARTNAHTHAKCNNNKHVKNNAVQIRNQI